MKASMRLRPMLAAALLEYGVVFALFYSAAHPEVFQ